MAYYDRIAKQWHQATGYKGGAFKQYVLNEVLLNKIASIENRSILELGAGNGYFLPLLLRHFSSEQPSSIIITDQSTELLKIAQNNFGIPDAQYQSLDVRNRFSFEDNCFDIIIAVMVFNEVPPKGFQYALQECYRTLSPEGILLFAVTHPDFIASLHKRGLLLRADGNTLTTPGSGNLRLPVIVRSAEVYYRSLKEIGFEYESEDVFPTPKVLNEKSGLKNVANLPLALVLKCIKSSRYE